MTSEKGDTGRRDSMAKMAKMAQVVAQCAEPGVSVAKIAMAHGINANVIHCWRKLTRVGDGKAATKTGEFIALPLTMLPHRRHPATVSAAGGPAGRTAPRRDHDVHHLADQRCRRVRPVDSRGAQMVRVDAVWLTCEPLNMRAGTESVLGRVGQVFGEARPHHAYLFANRLANRM
ncbi:transposase [Xylophilus sp. Leaf220]|uniref:transposase n=1 Tax=Xylophilus sp. Leaf220 TaxID=1735686 RepID=UPI0009EB6723|nr:transposase [Xylophilus sp. Leaf220]